MNFLKGSTKQSNPQNNEWTALRYFNKVLEKKTPTTNTQIAISSSVHLSTPLEDSHEESSVCSHNSDRSGSTTTVKKIRRPLKIKTNINENYEIQSTENSVPHNQVDQQPTTLNFEEQISSSQPQTQRNIQNLVGPISRSFQNLSNESNDAHPKVRKSADRIILKQTQDDPPEKYESISPPMNRSRNSQVRRNGNKNKDGKFTNLLSSIDENMKNFKQYLENIPNSIMDSSLKFQQEEKKSSQSEGDPNSTAFRKQSSSYPQLHNPKHLRQNPSEGTENLSENSESCSSKNGEFNRFRRESSGYSDMNGEYPIISSSIMSNPSRKGITKEIDIEASSVEEEREINIRTQTNESNNSFEKLETAKRVDVSNLKNKSASNQIFLHFSNDENSVSNPESELNEDAKYYCDEYTIHLQQLDQLQIQEETSSEESKLPRKLSSISQDSLERKSNNSQPVSEMPDSNPYRKTISYPNSLTDLKSQNNTEESNPYKRSSKKISSNPSVSDNSNDEKTLTQELGMGMNTQANMLEDFLELKPQELESFEKDQLIETILLLQTVVSKSSFLNRESLFNRSSLSNDKGTSDRNTRPSDLVLTMEKLESEKQELLLQGRNLRRKLKEEQRSKKKVIEKLKKEHEQKLEDLIHQYEEKMREREEENEILLNAGKNQNETPRSNIKEVETKTQQLNKKFIEMEAMYQKKLKSQHMEYSRQLQQYRKENKELHFCLNAIKSASDASEELKKRIDQLETKLSNQAQSINQPQNDEFVFSIQNKSWCAGEEYPSSSSFNDQIQQLKDSYEKKITHLKAVYEDQISQFKECHIQIQIESMREKNELVSQIEKLQTELDQNKSQQFMTQRNPKESSIDINHQKISILSGMDERLYSENKENIIPLSDDNRARHNHDLDEYSDSDSSILEESSIKIKPINVTANFFEKRNREYPQITTQLEALVTKIE